MTGATPEPASLHSMEDQHTEEDAILGLPNDAELVLLCLDYLRDLRRVYPPKALKKIEGIDANYLTMACWALNRAFVSPSHLTAGLGNDCFFDKSKAAINKSLSKADSPPHQFPNLEAMEKELLYTENPEAAEGDQKKDDEDQYSWYEYEDGHSSNLHRFYPLAGLASGPNLHGPLTLGEITAAGLTGLGARSRLNAEKDMIQSTLFDQFVQAVKDKGFFVDPVNETPVDDPIAEAERKKRQRAVYDDRYRKVVAKFRNKLSAKADGEAVGDLLALSAADQQRRRRASQVKQALADGLAEESDDDNDDATKSEVASAVGTTHLMSDAGTPKSYVRRTSLAQKILFGGGNNENHPDNTDKDSTYSGHNPVDVEEAEKLKAEGNTHMQRKEYQAAADCYTSALKLSPAGPNSHVYFSNRAAALVSMKKFHEAILDSERSLALKPDYGKAHARLGLAHFLLGNYRQALEAYTVALKYEPDNKSSKNYRDKAAKRLAEAGESADKVQSSYSVISEWEKSANQRNATDNEDQRQKVAGQREAEKFKVKGNSAMANREYAQALEAYTQAIRFSSDGPQSHIYYSNRAAAQCYMERYQEAEQDSMKSLRLNPRYGKAHARLGLSRFFLGNYKGAIDAYTAALRYDPDNAASKSYLAKAKAKLEMSSQPGVREAAARRMMEDKELRSMAAKAMADPSKHLLDDPEMQNLAKKAMADPSIMAAFGNK